MKVIDGQNHFNKKSFNEMCEVLEKAESIEVYIDCTGHTRNNDEQEAYREALENKYGDRLKVEKIDGAYSYSYTYGLKYFAAGGNNEESQIKR